MGQSEEVLTTMRISEIILIVGICVCLRILLKTVQIEREVYLVKNL